MNIYGIQKDGNNDPTCKAAKERDTDVKNRLGLCGRRRGWYGLREQH